MMGTKLRACSRMPARCAWRNLSFSTQSRDMLSFTKLKKSCFLMMITSHSCEHAAVVERGWFCINSTTPTARPAGMTFTQRPRSASNMSVDGRAMDVRRGDPGDGADGSGLLFAQFVKALHLTLNQEVDIIWWITLPKEDCAGTKGNLLYH